MHYLFLIPTVCYAIFTFRTLKFFFTRALNSRKFFPALFWMLLFFATAWALAAMFGHACKALAQDIPRKLLITQVDGKQVIYRVNVLSEPIRMNGCRIDGLTHCSSHIIDFYRNSQPALLVHEAEHAIYECDAHAKTMHEFIYDTAYPITKLFLDNYDLMIYLRTAKDDEFSRMATFSGVPKDCK